MPSPTGPMPATEAIQGLRIAAVGDISFNGGYHSLLSSGRAKDVLASVVQDMQADLLIGNLEAVLISERPSSPSWRFCLRGSPEYAKLLSASGFKVLTMSANHAMDYGWQGIEETLAVLNSSGIQTAGVGRNAAEARRPASLLIGDTKVAVLGYCSVHTGIPLYATATEPGVALADPKAMLEDVREAKREHQLVIVSMHWGDEYVQHPKPAQRRLARSLISAGATLVIGHHPHVLQGFEIVNGGAVAYSLGNFVFSDEEWVGVSRTGERFHWPMRFSGPSRETGILQATVNENGVAQVAWKSAVLEKDLILTRKPAGDCSLFGLSRAFKLGALYPPYWALQFFLARARTRYRQNFKGRDLSRFRLKHLRGLWAIFVHELEQWRGAKE